MSENYILTVGIVIMTGLMLMGLFAIAMMFYLSINPHLLMLV